MHTTPSTPPPYDPADDLDFHLTVTATVTQSFGLLRWEPGKVWGADPAPRTIGVVSQTGWGDGSYPVDVKRDADGLVVGVRVTFIEDGDDDGDDDDGDDGDTHE